MLPQQLTNSSFLIAITITITITTTTTTNPNPSDYGDGYCNEYGD